MHSIALATLMMSIPQIYGYACEQTDLISISNSMNISATYVNNLCYFEKPDRCEQLGSSIDDKTFQCSRLNDATTNNMNDDKCACTDGEIKADIVFLVDSSKQSDTVWQHLTSYLPQYYYDNIQLTYNREDTGNIDISWIFFTNKVEYVFIDSPTRDNSRQNTRNPVRWPNKYNNTYTTSEYPQRLKNNQNDVNPCEAINLGLHTLAQGPNAVKILIYEGFNSVASTCDTTFVSDINTIFADSEHHLYTLGIKYNINNDTIDLSGIEDIFGGHFRDCVSFSSDVFDEHMFDENIGHTVTREVTSLISDFICMYSTHHIDNDKAYETTDTPIRPQSRLEKEQLSRHAWTRDGTRFHEKEQVPFQCAAECTCVCPY